MTVQSSHLDLLEAESIHIFREAAAQFRKPVLMYSIGKDSTVLLHLARKAFLPQKPPFPLLHIDTTWKFKDMIAFRDKTARDFGLDLIVHTNEDGIKKGINPIDHAPSIYTDVMKTQPLEAGARQIRLRRCLRRRPPRRGSERAPRSACSPSARPAIAGIRAGSARRCGTCSTAASAPARRCAFSRCRIGPRRTSGATSLREKLEVVPLYFAAERPTIVRNGQLLVVDDDRLPLQPGEVPQMKSVRFRTLGC